MHSNKSSASPARSTSVVRDIILFVNSSAVLSMTYGGAQHNFVRDRLPVWLEQISCMLLLPSHRRVPDFDCSTNTNTNGGGGGGGVNNGPLVQFSVASGPDQKSLDLSRMIHSKLNAFFRDDDDEDGAGEGDDAISSSVPVRHLVRIAPNIACHRALAEFGKGQERSSGSSDFDSDLPSHKMPPPSLRSMTAAGSGVGKKIALGDIDLASSRRAGSVESTCSAKSAMSAGGTTRLARIQTYGNRASSVESKADAADRVIDFAFMLEACMDVTKISDPAYDPSVSSAAAAAANEKQRPRSSDSDSSDDDAAPSGGASGKPATPTLVGCTLTMRQVVIVVCGDFAFHAIARRKGVAAAAMAADGEAFLWTRNTNQLRWHAPELWRDRTGVTGTIAAASAAAAVAAAVAEKTQEKGDDGDGDACTGALDISSSNNPLLNLTETEMSMQFVEEEKKQLQHRQPQQQQHSASFLQQNISILADDEVDFAPDSVASPSPARKSVQAVSAAPTAAAPAARKTDNDDASVSAALAAIAAQEAAVQAQLQTIEKHEAEHRARSEPAVESSSAAPVVAAADDDEDEGGIITGEEAKPRQPRIVAISFAGPEKLSRTAAPVAAVAAAVAAAAETLADAVVALPADVSRVVCSPPQSALRRQQQPQPHVVEAAVGGAIPRYAAPLTRSLRSMTPTKQQPGSNHSSAPNSARGQPQQQQHPGSARSSSASSVGAAQRPRSSSIGSNASRASASARRPLGQRASTNNATNSHSDDAAAAAAAAAKRRAERLCPVNLGPKRTGADACLQLYKQGAAAVQRRSSIEERENERRRQQEEAELARLHAKHKVLSMHNVDHEESKRAAKKIVAALRADPFSEEGLQLVPNAIDKMPAKRVENMLSRLVPEGPKVPVRFQNKAANGGAPSSRPASSSSRASSSGAAAPATHERAWRHGGVAPSASSTSSANASRRSTPGSRTSSAGSSKAAAAARRTVSPLATVERLYENKEAKEALARRTQMRDENEVNSIIAQRKIDNPTWAKMCAKDGSIEDAYRRRLLRIRAEERRAQNDKKASSSHDARSAADSVMAH